MANKLFSIPLMHFASLTEIECSSTVQYSKKSGSGRIHATNHFRALESNFFRNPQMALGFMFYYFSWIFKKEVQCIGEGKD